MYCLPDPSIRHLVLVVDDTVANVAVLAEHLSANGLEIIVAQNGEE